MKQTRQLLVLLISLAQWATASAQSADKIISKHIEAIGGREKLRAIKTVKIENTFSGLEGEVSSVNYIVDGKGFRSETNLMGDTMIQVVSGKKGWMVNPGGGKKEPEDMPEGQFQRMTRLYYIVPLLDYKERGYKVELKGKEKLGIREVWKLQVTDSARNVVTYYLDTKSYHVLQQEVSTVSDGNVRTVFSDFRKTDSGWVLPFAQEMVVGPSKFGSKIKHLEVNPVIDPALFEKK